MQFLGAFAVRMAASPRWVISVFFLLLTVSLFLSLRLQVSTDISSLMPQHSRLSSSLLQALDDFGNTDRLILVLETSPANVEGVMAQRDALKELADGVVSGMEASDMFSTIAYRLGSEDRRFFEDLQSRYPFHYHSPEALKALKIKLAPGEIDQRVRQLVHSIRTSPLGAAAHSGLLRDPLGFRADSQAYGFNLTGFRLDVSDGYFFSEDGAALLILAEPVRPSQDTSFDSLLFEKLQQVLSEAGGSGQLSDDFSTTTGAGFKVQLLGPYVETLYGSNAAAKEILPSLLVTVFGLVLLFGGVYRSMRVILVLAVPLGAGILLTSGFISLFTAYLTMITVGFASMLAGLGVDFEIHLLERFTEERQAGSGMVKAINTAFLTTGKGVLAGALSTATIFLLIATSDFGALREFGWIMAAGILLILVSVFALLPLLFSSFSALVQLPPRALNTRRWHWLLSHSRLWVGLGLVLTVMLAVSAASLPLKSNIYQLGPVNAAYEVAKERVLNSIGGSTNMIVLVTEKENLQELLELNEETYSVLERLKSSGEIASFESLGSILPSVKSQLKVQQEVRQWGLATAMNRFENSLKSAGFRSEAFAPFIHNLLAYDSEDEYLIVPADFTGTAGEAWMDRFLLQTETGWRSVSYLYPNPGQWEERVPAEVLADLEGLDTELIVTGIVPVFGEISSYVQREFKRLTLLALFAVLLISLVFFRRPLVSLLSVVPALVGLVWTLGLMQILGIELNLVSMLVAPMILGLGIDDALHVLNRNEGSPGELEVSMASVSRGILMTSLTTLIGFGSLALSSLPSLQSLGITVSIGMVCCAVTSLVLLPALLRAFDSRS